MFHDSERVGEEDFKPASPAQADERTITGGACIDKEMKYQYMDIFFISID